MRYLPLALLVTALVSLCELRCAAKRDETLKPGPTIWDPKKVQVQYAAGKKEDPKATARAKARPAPFVAQGRGADSKPAAAPGRAAMFTLDLGAPEEEYDDMQSTMREGKRSRTKTPKKCVHILREFLLTTKRPRKK